MKRNRFIFSFLALLLSAQVFCQEPTFTFVKEVAGWTEPIVKAGDIYCAYIEDVGLKAFNNNGDELWTYLDSEISSGFNIKADNHGNIYVFGDNSESKVVYIRKLNNEGNVLWSRQSQSNNAEDARIRDLAVDDLGNVYITGAFYADDITFSTVTLTNTSGSYDFYIFKFNSNGETQWGDNGNIPYNMKLYINGSDIYLANSWYGIYLVKYNTNGNALWSFSAGSSDDRNDIENLLFDNNGNLFIVGNFEADTLNFGGVTFYNSNTTAGFTDMFLAKFNSSGNLLFVNSYQVNAYDGIRTICNINSENNITITGGYRAENLTFGEFNIKNSNYEPITEGNSGGASLFIVQFDELGNAKWAKSVIGVYPHGGFDNNGNLYLLTYFDENGISIDDISIEFNGNQFDGENINSALFKLGKNGAAIYGVNFGATGSSSFYVNESEILFGGFFYQSLSLGDINLTADKYGFYIALLKNETNNINSIAENKEILIYPNPTNDFINMKAAEYGDEIKFELYDINGKLVLSYKYSNSKKISLSNLHNGIYLYKFIGKDKVVSGRLIKE